MKYIRHLTLTLAILVHLVSPLSGSIVLAQEVPDPPSAPTAPSAPTPSTYYSETSSDPNPTTNTTPADTSEPAASSPTSSPTTNPSPEPNIGISSQSSLSPDSNQSNQTGDTLVSTGDANNTVTSTSVGNSNIEVVPLSSSTSNTENNPAQVSGNGTNSTNDIFVGNSDSSTANQDNSGSTQNGISQSTTTGGSSASFNVGDSAISSGNANTSGTLVNSLNSNLSGVSISEFNIADNHQGDIVLDFSSGCIFGCNPQPSASSSISGNGSLSQNQVGTSNTSSSSTNQSNNGLVGNNMGLIADSGSNSASFNTGGDSTVLTGDANIDANMVSFLNNNVAGNATIGIVNIYGALEGDIILPANPTLPTTASSSSVAIGSNGSSSENQSLFTASADTATFQSNIADIENTVNILAETGENNASGNTGGDIAVKTGEVTADVNTLNIANNNIEGGDIWLVLVNKAGEWFGQIMGAPSGSLIAGSQGLGFSIQEGSASNNISGNGAESTNTQTTVNQSSDQSSQTNNAAISNFLNLKANTGNNKTNFNTGGNSSIVTGDANVVVNLINFVNNNIKSTGKLFVTIVNVFGSWKGDFLPPGFTKDKGGSNNDSGQNTPQPSPTNTPATNEVSTSDDDQKSVSKLERPTRRFFSGYTPAITNAGDSEEEVLGTNSPPAETTTPKVIHLNLAWLLMLLPVALVATLRRIMLHH